MMKVDLKKYIGKKYEDYDCFALVKEFYLDHYGVDLKNYFEGSHVQDRNLVQSLIVSSKGDFDQVVDPQFGDIVVIRLHGIECHIGIVMPGKMFLHSARGIGSNMDRLSRYEKLIAGYFRLKGHT